MTIQSKLFVMSIAYLVTFGYALLIIGLVHGDLWIKLSAIIGMFIFTTIAGYFGLNDL